MDKNLLNIVDKNGIIIGIDTRENIHKQGLLHREIHIWFITPNEEVIFQQRSKNKDTAPNLLDATVGGHIEIGSDYLTTAILEAKEETGIDIRESDLELAAIVNTFSHNTKTGMINNALRATYFYKYNGLLADLKVEPEEGTGFQAYSVEKLERLTEEEKKKFISRVIDEEHIVLFKKIVTS